MTRILYCKDCGCLDLPDIVIKRYCAFKSIPEKDFEVDRADRDLIHFLEEYRELHPEDEEAARIGIKDIGNATQYVVINYYDWEMIYTKDTIPWRTVGVNDNDWEVTLWVRD